MDHTTSVSDTQKEVYLGGYCVILRMLAFPQAMLAGTYAQKCAKKCTTFKRTDVLNAPVDYTPGEHAPKSASITEKANLRAILHGEGNLEGFRLTLRVFPRARGRCHSHTIPKPNPLSTLTHKRNWPKDRPNPTCRFSLTVADGLARPQKLQTNFNVSFAAIKMI